MAMNRLSYVGKVAGSQYHLGSRRRVSLSIMLSDLRYAIRGFLRTPGFTAAAILSLALGIGANTAIFSVASALLLRPLPYADADRLVILWNRSPGLGITEDWFSTAQYFDIVHGHRGLEQVALAIGGNFNLTGEGEPERIGTIRLSSNLLPMLGVRAALGRLLLEREDAPGAPAVALLAHGTWMRRYGGASSAIGRTMTLNGAPYQIVGVLPESFALPRDVMPTLGGAEQAEVILPLPLGADAASIRTREDYNILGRLRRGASLAAAQAEMDTLTAGLRRDHPEIYPPNGGLTFGIVPLHEQVVGDVRTALSVLMGSVGLVLLVACANVANLLLSRALARQREIAVRTALGAGRARIVRQLLTESVLLAVAGGAAGLAAAWWSLGSIRVLGARSVPRLHEVGIDGGVLVFTLAVSVASGVLFGLVPALRLGGLDIQRGLRDAARGSAAPSLWGRGRHARRALVVAELALAVVLLIGAGLLVRSFARLQQVPPGFDPQGVLTLELTMTGRPYADREKLVETWRQLLERLATLPGVTRAGAVSALPLSQMFAWGPVVVEGRTPPPGEAFINADQRIVGGAYFETMAIPLLQGRLFNAADRRDRPGVVIVDASMANTLWPGVSPLGRRVRVGAADDPSPWLTVVGVVGGVKQYTLDGESRIAMYFPHAQFTTRALNVVVKSRTDASTLAADVRRVVRAIDPDLPMYGVRTMSARVDESLARRRFAVLLLSVFALLALGLATIGIYGVMAYLVHQGARELGIRMALGATPAVILSLILRHGLAIAAAGVTLGVVGALVLSRFIASLLFGVAATDAVTFVAIPAVLGAVSLIASLVPAGRAARIDPIVSLRSE
jgi:predicted permease